MTLGIRSGLKLLREEGFTVTKVHRVPGIFQAGGRTVRALHHYDRLGLLKPNRTEAGYRLYHLGDLARLEQIQEGLGIHLESLRRGKSSELKFHSGQGPGLSWPQATGHVCALSGFWFPNGSPFAAVPNLSSRHSVP